MSMTLGSFLTSEMRDARSSSIFLAIRCCRYASYANGSTSDLPRGIRVVSYPLAMPTQHPTCPLRTLHATVLLNASK
jgi:hypothetical protein